MTYVIDDGVLGLSFFSRSLENLGPLHCKVCGSACHIERDARIVGHWWGALAGLSRRHNRFVCPHVGAAWHKQVTDILVQTTKTPSDKLRAIMTEEIGEILAGNGIDFRPSLEEATE